MRRNLNAGRRAVRAARHAAVRHPDRPMTPAQAVQLKALAEEAREPDAFEDLLDADEAALRITALQAKLAHERQRRGWRPFDI
ncbi:MAG: DUF3072 domain-containing protein [Pseudorhodoplanes sp.]